MATAESIASEIVATLNASPPAGLSRPISARFTFRPRLRVEETSDSEASVSVVPASETRAMVGRGSVLITSTIEIGYQIRLGPQSVGDDDAQLAVLIDDVRRIEEALRFARMDGASWQGASHDPMVLAQHLDESRIFTSVIRLEYDHTA